MRFALLLSLLTFGTGCVDIIRAVMRPQQEKQDKEAEEKKKQAEAAKEQAQKDEDKAAAEAKAKALEDVIASKDPARLKAFDTRPYSNQDTTRWEDAYRAARIEQLAAVPCDKAEETFEAVRDGGNRASEKAVFAAGLERLATCKKWSTIFTTYLHFGDGPDAMGRVALIELDKRKIPVDQEFIAFMASATKNPFPKFPLQAVANFAEFRAQKAEGGQPCKAYLPMASKLTGDGLFPLLWLYSKLDCKEAADVVATALADDQPRNRERACWVLADIGTKKHIAKMKIVAEKDATFKMKGNTPVYWVRDSCQQAIGKLELKDK
jgi:hypothetical protein